MRIQLFALGIAVAVSSVLASCGASAPEDINRSSWPSCSWPSALDPDETGSARDHCVATRTRLACALPDGVTEICPTNNPLQCEGASAPAPDACDAECAPNEFSVRCGGAGPGSVPEPPAGCHSGVPTAAGIVFYCCPCG
ncbi:MAG TPA: hypothetical protein VFD36_25455 [Kofleriaceae bacterium]|nr:hypothetical protein [Kofleriaceae bacterium]